MKKVKRGEKRLHCSAGKHGHWKMPPLVLHLESSSLSISLLLVLQSLLCGCVFNCRAGTWEVLIPVSTNILHLSAASAALFHWGCFALARPAMHYEWTCNFQGSSAVPDLKRLRVLLAEQERAAKHRDREREREQAIPWQSLQKFVLTV